jgi:hypothetical protein
MERTVMTLAVAPHGTLGWTRKSNLVNGEQKTVHKGRRIHTRNPGRSDLYEKVRVSKTDQGAFVKTEDKTKTQYAIVDEL